MLRCVRFWKLVELNRVGSIWFRCFLPDPSTINVLSVALGKFFAT